MAKKNRSSKAKRSLGSQPRGLPQRKKPRGGGGGASNADNSNVNPFENARASSAKSAKFLVHNRPTQGSSHNAGPSTAMARSQARRKHSLRAALENDRKAGSFVDRRIGEGPGMTEEQRMMARVVRERARRSKKVARFALGDNDDDGAGGGGAGGGLTHKGRAIDDSYTGRLDAADVILSDDDDDRGQLDRVDTEMHFGGGSFDQSKRGRAAANPYGPSGGDDGGEQHSMADVYRSRKEELDDMIRRKKEEKAARAKDREEQAETFETLDESFKELAGLLQFRDKDQEKKAKMEAKKAGTLSKMDQEMDAWDREMKTYLFERRVKATDRTKTPEEIAKMEAERLHELETRRMARMNGDFEDDDLSDISDEEGGRGRKGRQLRKEKAKKVARKKSKKNKSSSTAERNPDELDSDVEDDNDELEVRFTADGLVYVDKDGKVVRKVDEDEGSSDDESSDGDDDDDDDDDDNESGSDDDGSDEEEESKSESEESSDAGIGGSEDEASAGEESSEDSDDDDDEGDDGAILAVGTKVRGNYHADEQFDGRVNWFEGTVTNVTTDTKGSTRYDITYNDGDFEEGMKPENVRRLSKTKEEENNDKEKAETKKKISAKKLKAKKKARYVILVSFFLTPAFLDGLQGTPCMNNIVRALVARPFLAIGPASFYSSAIGIWRGRIAHASFSCIDASTDSKQIPHSTPGDAHSPLYCRAAFDPIPLCLLGHHIFCLIRFELVYFLAPPTHTQLLLASLFCSFSLTEFYIYI